jgi:subtilisin family serine protease
MILFLIFLSKVLSLGLIDSLEKLFEKNQENLGTEELYLEKLLNEGIRYNDALISAKIHGEKLSIFSISESENWLSSQRYSMDLKNIHSKKIKIIDSEGNVSSFSINIDPETNISENIKNYIIEFEQEPFLIKKNEFKKQMDVIDSEIELKRKFFKETKPSKRFQILQLEKDIEILKSKKKNLEKIYEVKLLNHKNDIEKTHESAKREIRKILKTNNPRDLKIREFKNIYNGISVSIPEGMVDKFENLPSVKKIYPDLKVSLLLNNSVPSIGANILWTFNDSQNMTITGKNITISIIDTGVDYTHVDLGNCDQAEFLAGNCSKVIGGYDFINADNDPMDDHTHGTHCAGIAAGNGTLKGVAPDAKILAYKVLNYAGYGFTSDIIAAIEMAVDNNTDVISLSLGSEGTPEDPLSKAVDNAVDSGVVVAVAAGNTGPTYETIACPGVARKAITVGASNGTNGVAYFSSRGPVTWGDNITLKPEIVAPGDHICSAQWQSEYSEYLCIDEEHINISGTSMATPHVAGLAALLKQSHPDWNPEKIKSALMLSSNDLGEEIIIQGTGLVDAVKSYNTSILTSPTSISGKLKSQEGFILSREITIENLRDYQISVNVFLPLAHNKLGEVFNISSVNSTSFDIPANSNSTLNVSLNLTNTNHDVFGKILFEVEGNNYTFPYLGLKTVNLTVIVNSSDFEIYPELIVHEDNITNIIIAYQFVDFVGNNFTFGVSPGRNYTVYAFGDLNNYSIEYILSGSLELPDTDSNLILNFSDSRPFHIMGESLDGKSLLMYEWEKKLITYKHGRGFSSSFFWTGLGNRTVYISNKPENDVNTDIIFRYSGIPVG